MSAASARAAQPRGHRASSSSSSPSRSASPTGRRGARAPPSTSTPPAAASPALQNGLALAGDYMSAASFLGIAGLVALSGFDGLIYSIGFLVGLADRDVPDRRAAAQPRAATPSPTWWPTGCARRPVRIAAAIGTLAVVAFYLIAQMVGAGNLIRLLFGLSYETAVVIVGVVMLAYVLFGGMIATTWVQIVKAVLLLGGAFAAGGAGAARASRSTRWRSSPRAADALRRAGAGARASSVSDPLDAISLGLALMFGTAGLPHILMRFYTVPDARTARTLGLLRHRLHRLLLPADVHPGLRRDGAGRAATRSGPSTRAATWRRRCWPRPWAARASSASSPPSPSPPSWPWWPASRSRARPRSRTTCG